MNHKHKTLAAAAAALIAQSAGAVTTPVFTGVVLTGLTNLQTDIGAFNVTFTRGTCAEVFGATACGSVGTPFGITQADAFTIATALNTFMFTQDKTKLPGFDGLNSTTGIRTPFSIVDRFMRIGPAQRRVGEGIDSYQTAFNSQPITDGVALRTATSTLDTLLFATYTPYVAPPSAIPEPGTWLMLGLGFGLVGAVARRRGVPGTVVSRL